MEIFEMELEGCPSPGLWNSNDLERDSNRCNHPSSNWAETEVVNRTSWASKTTTSPSSWEDASPGQHKTTARAHVRNGSEEEEHGGASPIRANHKNVPLRTEDRLGQGGGGGGGGGGGAEPAIAYPTPHTQTGAGREAMLAAATTTTTTTMVKNPNSGSAKYQEVKAKYLRSLKFNEQDVQKRVLSSRHRSLSLPMSIPELGPLPSEMKVLQQQHKMEAQAHMSSSLLPESVLMQQHPTAIPIPSRRNDPLKTAGAAAADPTLSDLTHVSESTPPKQASLFVPPHELVKRDTFSVWQYEQKKSAANKAV